jgi:hypothetical protein
VSARAKRRLRLVASNVNPEPAAAPRLAVQIVTDCKGMQWCVSPRLRTAYVLAGTPEQIGERLTKALAAYGDSHRPQLRVAGGGES